MVTENEVGNWLTQVGLEKGVKMVHICALV